MAKSPKLLVYIAGYGRSGSTLLDTVLSSHPQLEGVGEIKYLFREVLDQKQLPAIWSTVLEEFAAQGENDITTANQLTLTKNYGGSFWIRSTGNCPASFWSILRKRPRMLFCDRNCWRKWATNFG